MVNVLLITVFAMGKVIVMMVLTKIIVTQQVGSVIPLFNKNVRIPGVDKRRDFLFFARIHVFSDLLQYRSTKNEIFRSRINEAKPHKTSYAIVICAHVL